jgi:molybdopterin synthase catalytic subunit
VIRCRRTRIDTAAVVADAAGAGDGAILRVSGTVRNVNAGKRVLFLEYEATPAWRSAKMERIARRRLSPGSA